MAKKDVQIKELFGNLAETESTLKSVTTKPEQQSSENITTGQISENQDNDTDNSDYNEEDQSRKAYRDRVDAIHGKPTTVRLKPTTIQRVSLATRKFRVKKGDFYNFAINYFLDQLEQDPTILPVTPAKYDIDAE